MTKTKEPVITIKVGDWAEEYQAAEPQITSEDDLVALVAEQGMSTSKAARLAIMGREFGAIPEGVMPENKPLLMTGGAKAVSDMIVRRRKEVKLESGKTISVREFVAPVREEEIEDENPTVILASGNPYPSLPETFAPVIGKEARDRALDYLLKVVPGYIMGRLEIIAANGGDVPAAANQLKALIDEMVEQLG